MKKLLMVKYAEVHLKGQNRPYFQRLLLKRVLDTVKPLSADAWLHDSRIFVSGYKDEEECIRRVCRVFGVHAVCPVLEMGKSSISDICEKALAMMDGLEGTFKVVAMRADKRYALDSPRINAIIGEYIRVHAPHLTVDVHHPDHKLQVEIRDNALLYVRDIKAVGGMPVGSNAKALLLLSGGIDSPVAGYRIAKRGVEISAVYFHSFPYTGEAVKEKVLGVTKILAGYCGKIHLFVVSITQVQQMIVERCPDEYTTLVLRRCMMRLAERVAQQEGALALITGESIGQVASQTTESLACTNAAVNMPVFRPLIGMDKLEIIRESEQIGTYQTSCLPYEDCCTVFTPRHPATRPKLEKVEAAERALNEDHALRELFARAMETAELHVIVPEDASDSENEGKKT